MLPAISLALVHLPSPKLLSILSPTCHQNSHTQEHRSQTFLKVPASGTSAARCCDITTGGTSGSGDALPGLLRTTPHTCQWTGEVVEPALWMVLPEEGQVGCAQGGSRITELQSRCRGENGGATRTPPVAGSPAAPWERVSLYAGSQRARKEPKFTLGLHLRSTLSLVVSPRNLLTLKLSLPLQIMRCFSLAAFKIFSRLFLLLPNASMACL